ncbi:hypothetical protein Ahia01_001249100, partial [Argonauta hians]
PPTPPLPPPPSQTPTTTIPPTTIPPPPSQTPTTTTIPPTTIPPTTTTIPPYHHHHYCHTTKTVDDVRNGPQYIWSYRQSVYYPVLYTLSTPIDITIIPGLRRSIRLTSIARYLTIVHTASPGRTPDTRILCSSKHLRSDFAVPTSLDRTTGCRALSLYMDLPHISANLRTLFTSTRSILYCQPINRIYCFYSDPRLRPPLQRRLRRCEC